MPRRYYQSLGGSPAHAGMTQERSLGHATRRGSPAHAGMDPSVAARMCAMSWLPRTRGDGPGEGSHLASGLSEPEVETIVTALCAVAEPVETRFLWRPQLHDPADEMVLEAAINGAADALGSFQPAGLRARARPVRHRAAVTPRRP